MVGILYNLALTPQHGNQNSIILCETDTNRPMTNNDYISNYCPYMNYFGKNMYGPNQIDNCPDLESLNKIRNIQKQYFPESGQF